MQSLEVKLVAETFRLKLILVYLIKLTLLYRFDSGQTYNLLQDLTLLVLHLLSNRLPVGLLRSAEKNTILHKKRHCRVTAFYLRLYQLHEQEYLKLCHELLPPYLNTNVLLQVLKSPKHKLTHHLFLTVDRKTLIINRLILVVHKVREVILIHEILNITILPYQDFHLFQCESLKFRDDEVPLSQMSFKLHPVLKVFMNIKKSYSRITAKEHHCALWKILLLGLTITAIELHIFNTTD